MPTVCEIKLNQPPEEVDSPPRYYVFIVHREGAVTIYPATALTPLD